MMCQSIGLPPISTIGFGRVVVSSLRREPKPPAKITAFTILQLTLAWPAPHTLALRESPTATRACRRGCACVVRYTASHPSPADPARLAIERAASAPNVREESRQYIPLAYGSRYAVTQAGLRSSGNATKQRRALVAYDKGAALTNLVVFADGLLHP